MNLIALILGLLVERLATKLFHLRRLPWLDRLIDAGLRQVQKLATWPPIIPVILLTLLLVLPIAAISLAIGDRALGLPYVAFAIFVLFFSFGPKDIGEDVDEYCTALEEGDKDRIKETAQAIVEGDVPDDELQCIRKVEEAICVHANNRLFAVIFWFVVLGLFGPLGPLGAWAYRVTDLIRRRAVATTGADEGADSTAALLRNAALLLHGWLAWVPLVFPRSVMRRLVILTLPWGPGAHPLNNRTRVCPSTMTTCSRALEWLRLRWWMTTMKA